MCFQVMFIIVNDKSPTLVYITSYNHHDELSTSTKERYDVVCTHMHSLSFAHLSITLIILKRSFTNANDKRKIVEYQQKSKIKSRRVDLICFELALEKKIRALLDVNKIQERT